MNKLQKRLGDGCNYGMMYILLGGGLIIHLPLAIWLSLIFDNSDYGMGLSWILYFVIGLLLEAYCQIQRDKMTYNAMVDREKQLNLFRDFGISLENNKVEDR